MYEDVEAIIALTPNQRNNAKILGLFCLEARRDRIES
jgi:hypothetical protein